MRFALFVLAVGCTVDVKSSAPPAAGGDGVVVDLSQRVSVNKDQVPLVLSCGAGEVVRKTATAWECAAPAVLPVSFLKLVDRPDAYAPDLTKVAADTAWPGRVAWASIPDVPPTVTGAAQATDLTTASGRIDDLTTKLNNALARIDALEKKRPTYSVGAISVSVNAGFKCATASVGGAIASTYGYATAKTLCESACHSATAHVCTGDELVRSVEAGAPITYGWYASGTAANSGGVNNDCGGFSHGGFGSVWNNDEPGIQGCGGSNPMLCCD